MATEENKVIRDNPFTESFLDGIAYFFIIGENQIEKHYHKMVRMFEMYFEDMRENYQPQGIMLEEEEIVFA